MAVHLSDVLLRRTALGAGGYPGDAVVRSAAATMAAECGWPPSRVEEEISAVRDFYRIDA